MLISLVVAVSQNGVIGAENDLPWSLPADLRHFKTLTTGHHIVMGRKTYASIGRPLPKRANLVISRQQGLQIAGATVCNSAEQALEVAKVNGETEFFVIGGASIYEMFLPMAHRIFYTEVGASVEGSVYFPRWDKGAWEAKLLGTHPADARNEHPMKFWEYSRK